MKNTKSKSMSLFSVASLLVAATTTSSVLSASSSSTTLLQNVFTGAQAASSSGALHAAHPHDDHEIVFDDSDIAGDIELYEDYQNGNADNNNNNIASGLAGLTDLFSFLKGCDNELIPPEESCCHPPGVDTSPDAPHECFAPPIFDEDHPWDSPALKEAINAGRTALSVTDFEEMVGALASSPKKAGDANAVGFGTVASSSSSSSVAATVKGDANDKANSILDGDSTPLTTFSTNNKVVIIDTRCASEFVAGHIPGAVFGGLGTDQFDRFIGTVHSDHNIPVVFIPPTSEEEKSPPQQPSSETNNSTATSSSHTAPSIDEIAQRLVKAGLSNLKGYLKGGMSAWRKANKPVIPMPRWNSNTLAKKLVAAEVGQQKGGGAASPLRQSLVDLREPCASDSNSLPNSESIPVTETILLEVSHRAQHEKDPHHPLVLFCSNGFRSLMVTSALKAVNPAMNVVCMDEGFDDLIERDEIKALQQAR